MLAYCDVAPEVPLMYAARPSIPMTATMLSETMLYRLSTLQDVVDPILRERSFWLSAFGKISSGI